MTLTEYISDLAAYHRQNQGYVGFGQAAADVKKLCHALQQARIAHIGISVKNLKNLIVIPDEIAHCVIEGDLAAPALYTTLDSLLNRLMLPLRLQGKTVSFLSKAPRQDYEPSISSDFLHRDLPQIEKGLLLEQLLILLDAETHASLLFSTNERTIPAAALDLDLDDSQKKAIVHRLGPIRVLAPAGSGKTKTLTNRIIHLINEGIKPESILALAFNKKAADEMMQRLHRRGIPVARRLHLPGAVVRTFHGLGYELIRRELGWQFDGDTEQDRLRALLQRAIENHYSAKQRRNQDPLDPFLAAVNICKMDLAPLADFMVETEEDSVPFAPIFEDLLQLQLRNKFCTFDDMIYLAVRLLLDRPALRRKMQSRFHYLLIDEFQDLNRAQIMMMQILSLPQNNLFVVGDDDQMIYGWRGADLRHILEFPARYSGAADCTLSTNYRSTQAIVRHSRWLIEHNRRRVFKDISAVPSAPMGQVEILLADSLWQQAQAAADWIREEQQKRRNPWEEFAVLFRYHAYKYVAAILLDAAGLPHTPVDGRSLAQTAVGRDVMAYLTIILWPEKADQEHLARALKRPNKYFTSHFIHSIRTYQDLEQAPHTLTLPEWMLSNLEDFLADLRFMRQQAKRSRAPATLLNTLASVFNLREFYRTQVKRYAQLDEAGLDVLLEVMIAVAQAFASIEDFYLYLTKSLSAPLRTSAPTDNRQGIVLSTIHASKGREFKNVVLFNLSETYRSSDTEDSEEERRVAYVGLTRGSDHVFITALTKSPSPFIHELALNPATKNFSDIELRRMAEKLRNESAQLGKTAAATTTKLQTIYDRRDLMQQAKQTPQNEKKSLRIANDMEKEEKRLQKLHQRQLEAEKEYQALQQELHFRRLLLYRGR